MRSSDWSLVVCSSDLAACALSRIQTHLAEVPRRLVVGREHVPSARAPRAALARLLGAHRARPQEGAQDRRRLRTVAARSEERRVGQEYVSTGRTGWGAYN